LTPVNGACRAGDRRNIWKERPHRLAIFRIFRLLFQKLKD
jgi:hypothetical protein